MGYQRFSERKRRQVSLATGIDWERVWNHQGGQWEGRVIVDGKCRHALIDHHTFDVVWTDDPIHFDTCPQDV